MYKYFKLKYHRTKTTDDLVNCSNT